MRRTSLIRLAVVPVVSLVVLTGCGSSEEGSSSGGSSSGSSSSAEDSGSGESAEAAEPLTKGDFGDRIYAAFKDAGTLKFEITQTGTASSTGSGEADISGEQVASKVTQEVQGAGSVEAIVLDGLFYLKSAQISGEKWLKVDPEAKDGLGALVGSLGGNSDPAKLLQVMNQASEVTDEGTEEVGGVETTKYHVVLPREAFAETLGDNPQITQMLPETVEFDMWVDGEDLVRKQASELTVGGQKTASTILYSGFGDPVEIEAPPASQTTTKAPGLGG
ncbi:DUF7537 family lipoprotein [Nocardioides aurantiacus]|uniref:Lipoprotein LprG n=1 Tax=Nocardioides aurantiacus TaxID=86796 RepID=A0A3N2CQ95_9ACTN|nr:hypothetical protein [Nocardioides aurantiacus]ROR89578.1 hypothetical protein EDD33_0407 [Nocardioides aurantiacus]